MAIITYNRLRKATKRKLAMVDKRDQDAFDRWLASQRASKTSQQVDLPSSQLPCKMSLVSCNHPQLFAIVDTCSIVTYRNEFIDHVVHLKSLFARGNSPIKFIVSLVVLEELDKCNRPAKKKPHMTTKSGTPVQIGNRFEQTSSDKVPIKVEGLDSSTKDFVTSINTLLLHSNHSNQDQHIRASMPIVQDQPPRLFMRFLEEEMRLAEVLIGELDPFRKTQLPLSERDFEILNKDDRILECCLRSKAFVRSLPHHSDTQIVLISEDNVFKSKATTFGVSSFRWREFRAKFKNFGLENYVATPLMPPHINIMTGSQEVTKMSSSRAITCNSPTSTDSSKGENSIFKLHRSHMDEAKPQVKEDEKNTRAPPKKPHLDLLTVRNIYGNLPPAVKKARRTQDDPSVILVREVINLVDEPGH